MEAKLNYFMEKPSLWAPKQDGFRWAFAIIDHIFTLGCLIHHTNTCKWKLYGRFMDFCKAFETILRDDMIWAIYALYQQVFGHLQYVGGQSICVTSTIDVK